MFPDTTFKYLFTLYEKGAATALTEQKLNFDIKDIAKAAGITQRMHAHLFRHTLAMHLIADGRTIVDVMQKLRHKNIATTSIYLSSIQKQCNKRQKHCEVICCMMLNL